MHKWLNIGIVHSSFNESRIFFCLNKPPCDDPINRKERNELGFLFFSWEEDDEPSRCSKNK